MAEDDDRALFERAMQNLTEEELFDGKYGASTDSESSPVPAEADPDVGDEVVREVREFATMEDAFFDVTPIERTKHRVKKTPLRPHVDEPLPAVVAPFAKEEKRAATEQTRFEQFARETAAATVIDCRGMSESVAFRKLAIEFAVGHAARIVFEKEADRDGLDRASLTAWATGLSVDFTFSPDSTETEGLMLIR